MASYLSCQSIPRIAVRDAPWPTDLLSRRTAFRHPFAQQGRRLCPARLQRDLKVRAIGFDLGTETGKGKVPCWHALLCARLVERRLSDYPFH